MWMGRRVYCDFYLIWALIGISLGGSLFLGTNKLLQCQNPAIGAGRPAAFDHQTEGALGETMTFLNLSLAGARDELLGTESGASSMRSVATFGPYGVHDTLNSGMRSIAHDLAPRHPLQGHLQTVCSVQALACAPVRRWHGAYADALRPLPRRHCRSGRSRWRAG